MKKFLTTTAFAATAATSFAGPALADGHAACGEVSITEMDWASAAIVTNVAKFLMEQGYGCDVSAIPSATTPAMVSVAETGSPDIVTEVWTNGNPGYDELSAAGAIVTLADVLSDGGVQGFYVPTYLVEEHPELATVEGVLANPELIGGRLHSCPDGWACKNTTTAYARAAGFEEAGIEVFQHGSGETLATSMASAVENGEPWLGYYWEPTSIMGKYDMTQVDLGPFDQETFDCNSDPNCEEIGVTSYPVVPVKTVVTTTFQEEHPDLTELLNNVRFTNDQMGEVLAWQDDNSASVQEASVYFLTTYSDVWQEWVNDAARENLAALLQ
ncbi:glycine betaine/proline transport system substrate-binding protein [Jannaschia faecimaris]|uniref:Glycine betaine/proline transport system substrate-binding protein n=1 Tax=Jannaschia faecimaris TaxID=1244108 RepID=A0A1H3T2U6_9RHOB|nr:glycine betaine ABC transporter substrate-binding protein [Jannaschia faecimaris]SDZ43669.1 glycine betaine/proline transport system substrate-binding protein [Jannaschia faecimaris]